MPGAARAPEVIGCTSGSGYTTTADMWSTGCIMYWMFSGALPYEQEDEVLPKFFRLVAADTLTLPPAHFGNVSDNCKDLMCAMLKG